MEKDQKDNTKNSPTGGVEGALDNIFAALIFFTRVPFWKLHEPRREAYKTVVEHWPLVGWFTAIVMGGTMYLASLVFPWQVAVIMGICARLLVTGALHEDGLADFCDGFGAGGDRQRTLDIMKDSHIGTYGVLALIVYFVSLYTIFSSMRPEIACLLILAGDPYAKMVSGQLIQFLPYARTEEQSKAKTIYRKISVASGISLLFQAAIPMAVAYYFLDKLGAIPSLDLYALIYVPCIVMFVMYRMMANRLQGYTGDCCGALFLCTEISFYLTALV